MWWMCRPPGVMLPGHQRTLARIIRTLTRISTNDRMKPASSRNSGCLCAATMCVR